LLPNTGAGLNRFLTIACYNEYVKKGYCRFFEIHYNKVVIGGAPMFKKKKWIIASILAAVVIITVGVVGIAVYAASPTTTPTPTKTAPVDPQKALADKVAGILKVDPATVEAAFTKAQQELNTERAAANLKAEEARIDQMVTDGKMTAADAKAYETWLEAKPNVTVPGAGQTMPNFQDARPGMGGMMDKGAMPFNRGQVKPSATPSTTSTPK